MRLLKKAISGKPPSGFVDILPEDDEDLWHAYNLIHVGDSVTAGTFRKVRKILGLVEHRLRILRGFLRLFASHPVDLLAQNVKQSL